MKQWQKINLPEPQHNCTGTRNLVNLVMTSTVHHGLNLDSHIILTSRRKPLLRILKSLIWLSQQSNPKLLHRKRTHYWAIFLNHDCYCWHPLFRVIRSVYFIIDVWLSEIAWKVCYDVAGRFFWLYPETYERFGSALCCSGLKFITAIVIAWLTVFAC